MAITASGIGSGIDINGLVEQLVAAERSGPEQLLNNREFELESELSAIGQVKSSMSTFLESLESLSSPAAFLVYSGNSSDSDVATISANETARGGSFNLIVSSLASNYKTSSDGFADSDTTEVGTGDITIANGNGDSFTLSFAGSGDNTLSAIRDAINNSEDNFGVTATILNVDDGLGGTESKLILSADDSGTSNALTISADAGIAALDSSNMTDIGVVTNASVTIDGQTITSASNTLSNVISGITIELEAEGSSTLTVSSDLDGVVENVQSFIESFNAMQGVFNATSSYNDGNPGPLFSDATVRGIQSSISDTIASTIGSAAGSYNNLASIGITTTENGSLKLDTEYLKNVLADDFNAVSNVFTADDGIAAQFSVPLEEYTKFSGLLDNKRDSLNDRMSLIDTSRDNLDYRLFKLEQRLSAQFIAMDLLVQNLNSTGSFLTQQLDNLPGFTRDS